MKLLKFPITPLDVLMVVLNFIDLCNATSVQC